MDLGLAQIGLTAADEQRLKALMSVVIQKRASQYRWNLGTPDTANLIIVAADSPECADVVARNLGKARTVAVLAGESDGVPAGCERLGWPMQFGNLVALLMRAELSVERTRKAAAPQPSRKAAPPPRPRTASTPGKHLNKLAMILLDGSGVSGDEMIWRVDGISSRPLYLVPQKETFSYAGTLIPFRSLDPDIELEFTKIPITDLPSRDAQRPIVMLQWEIGLRCGTLGLFSWLKAEGVFQLRRFPEFAILHHTPEHRRLAAFLSRPRRGLSSVCKIAGTEESVITEFVNAASLCGYLRDAPAAPPKQQAGAPSAVRRALLGSIRKALGIRTANG